MPTKKPRGAELTLEQDLANQALHQRRLRIEHVNSSVKRCPQVQGVRLNHVLFVRKATPARL